ncbi:hypothetical protein CC117_30355 [Parafrankia colletiae]|uniref:Uncharacterized protein n=2 Tax=Parafrankia colletiae TaxID=573497 RepID=A0A1S1Q4W6_9ACTN|nr:hypothetical protein CC117_30355 [Parafrankia colletiae]
MDGAVDELEIAWRQLSFGQKVTASLPHLAAQALADGHDSPALRELAGLGVRDDLLARRLLPLVLEELDRDLDRAPGGWGRTVPWETAREQFEAGLVDRTDHALTAVRRDLAEIGGTVGRLTLHWAGSYGDDGEPHLLVGFDGEPCRGGGNPAEPLSGRDLAEWVLSLAANTQEAVMELFLCYWPTCARHRRGLHLHDSYANGDDEGERGEQGWPVWRCRAEGGHLVAPVGGLGTGSPTGA